MISNQKESETRIIHVPTGMTVLVDCNYSRSFRKQKEAALKILRSKLWMMQQSKD